jgi:hypothetical protein
MNKYDSSDKGLFFSISTFLHNAFAHNCNTQLISLSLSPSYTLSFPLQDLVAAKLAISALPFARDSDEIILFGVVFDRETVSSFKVLQLLIEINTFISVLVVDTDE